MVKYNTDKSFTDNMDALYSELEEQRKDQTDKRVVAVIDHVQNAIDNAKQLYKQHPVEAVCEVANALSISLGDVRIFAYEGCATRCEVFGNDTCYFGIASMYHYINDMVCSVGRDKIMNCKRNCTCCGQEYEVYSPKEWNDGRDASAVKKVTRAFNTNSSYEFLCLSGMCDACWQKHFNKGDCDE